MILEIAILSVKKGSEEQFEENFSKAEKLISSMPGYINHSLKKCIEKENYYLLSVNWNKLEDHTVGFRKSEKYLEWKNLLHHFYDPFPEVFHFEDIKKLDN